MNKQKISELYRTSLCLALVLVYFFFYGGVVSAISRTDIADIVSNKAFYRPESEDDCIDDGSSTADAGTNKTYILGDSIIDWFANASDAKATEYGVTPGLLKTALSNKGVDATIQAKGGRQLKGSHYGIAPDGIGQIEADQELIKTTSSVVVALGTNRNDPWDSNTKDDFKGSVSATIARLKELNPSVKIFWVNVAYTGETLTTDPPGTYAYADSFNDYNQVLNELATSEDFTILDWKAKVDATPSLISTAYGDLDGYAHVHPSPEGAGVYANLIADAVGTTKSTSTNSTANNNVYILGDSITVRGAEKYKTILEEKGKKVDISAVVARSWTADGTAKGEGWQVGTTGNGEDATKTDEAIIKEAGTIIIALGSNGFSGGNPIDKIASTMKSINADAQIFWVNVASGPADNKDVIKFNDELKEKAVDNGFKVIEWSKLVDPNGNGTHNSAELLEGDTVTGLHPTVPNGIDALVKLVTDTVTSEAAVPALTKSEQACKCTTPTNGRGGSVVLTGGDNVEKVYNYFISKGLGPIQAAAITGNFMLESGPSIDPKIVNSIGAYGIAQWLFGRKTALHSRTGYDTLEVQLDFSWEELNGPYKKSSLDPMNATEDLKEAVYIFEAHYEIAGAIPSVMAKRVAFAQSVLDSFGSNTGSGSSATTTSECDQGSMNGTTSSASCETTTSLPLPADIQPTWFNNHNHGNSVSFPVDEGKHRTIINPVKGTHYDNEAIKNSTYEYGEATDIGMSGGTKVFAPTDGTVLRSKQIHADGKDGYYVVIESSNKRCVSLMAHTDAPLVNEGDTVTAGQEIGKLKEMGNAHLHFELWVSGTPVNIGEDPDPCSYASCKDTFADEAEQIWYKQKQILMGQ